jgi:hypothetical protein
VYRQGEMALKGSSAQCSRGGAREGEREIIRQDGRSLVNKEWS